jgi:hypothetical protein
MKVITSMMQASEKFNEFINSERGLPILLKNLTIYGADELQEAVPQWIAEQKQLAQKQEQMAQQAMQQNPQMIRAQVDMQKVQLDAQKTQFDNQIKISKMAVEKELADAKILEAESKITQAQIDSAVRLEETQTSQHNHALEAASKLAEIASKRHNDALAAHKLNHEINMSNKDENGRNG